MATDADIANSARVAMEGLRSAGEGLQANREYKIKKSQAETLRGMGTEGGLMAGDVMRGAAASDVLTKQAARQEISPDNLLGKIYQLANDPNQPEEARLRYMQMIPDLQDMVITMKQASSAYGIKDYSQARNPSQGQAMALADINKALEDKRNGVPPTKEGQRRYLNANNYLNGIKIPNVQGKEGLEVFPSATEADMLKNNQEMDAYYKKYGLTNDAPAIPAAQESTKNAPGVVKKKGRTPGSPNALDRGVIKDNLDNEPDIVK